MVLSFSGANAGCQGCLSVSYVGSAPPCGSNCSAGRSMSAIGPNVAFPALRQVCGRVGDCQLYQTRIRPETLHGATASQQAVLVTPAPYSLNHGLPHYVASVPLFHLRPAV